MEAQLNSTNDPTLSMPSSWHTDYREEYAQSVFSGHDTLPDHTLPSPQLDYPIDQSMGQRHNGEEALAFAGALAGTIPLDQLHMNDDPALTLSRVYHDAPQDSDTLILSPGTNAFISNMKRPYQHDTQQQPNKKRSRPGSAPRSQPDQSFVGSFASASSQGLGRNLSSGGQSSQYQPSATSPYSAGPSRVTETQWHQSQFQSSSTQEEVDHQTSHPQDRQKKEKPKKKYPCNGCSNKVFTTSNDLDRHRRTVHSEIKPRDRVWMCSIGNCSTGRKVWARQDNFKQHITRMHSAEYHENMVDQMAVQFDPSIHDIDVGKKQTRKASTSVPSGNGLAQREGLAFDVSAAQGVSRDRGSQGHSHSPMGSGASMRNNPGLSSAASSSFGMRYQQGQHGTSQHSRLFNPTSRRAIPATVANPEAIAHQQRELRHQNNVALPAFVPGPAQDFSMMMGGEDHSLDQVSSTSQSGSFRNNQSGTHGLRLESIEEHDILKMFGNLPLESQQRLRTVISAVEGPTGMSHQRSASNSRSQNVPKADSVKNVTMFTCSKQGCGKQFAKRPELTKHERRHDRRYGCTFDQCFKKFGTKWEWKRHERSQHVQNKEWRCDVKEVGGICGQCFDGERAFESHLHGFHRIAGVASHEKLQSCLLARKWIGSFWCGFCEKVIQQEQDLNGNDCLEERYNHISEHIDNKEYRRNMSQWIEVRGSGKTKAESKESAAGASFNSPTSEMDTSPTHTEQNEDESPDEEDDSSEGDNIGENDATEKTAASLYLNTAQARALQSNQGQGESSSNVRTPTFTLTPAENYETQLGYASVFQHNEMVRPRSHSDIGYSSFTRQCTCGMPILEIGVGESVENYCQNCGPQNFEDFLNTEYMGNLQ